MQNRFTRNFNRKWIIPIAVITSYSIHYTKLYDIYGETETGPVAASHAAWYDSAGQDALGRAVPGVTLAVVDADGDPISSGGVGRLAVAREHPGLCLGCVDSHQALARWAREKYVGRWLV